MNCLFAQGAPLAPSSLTQMISGLVGQLLMPGQFGWCQVNFILRAANKPTILYFYHDACHVVACILFLTVNVIGFFVFLNIDITLSF